jgi:activator of HSP90 ATPase
MKTKRIKQTITFPGALPREVYSLIMDARKHSAFTGSKVTMSNKVNGKFKMFDGYCSGFNIELNEGKKIVQGWYFKEDGWPEDHYSICTFIFEKIPSGTKLIFTQTHIPEHKVDTLKEGWKLYYWQPMKAYLAGKHSI